MIGTAPIIGQVAIAQQEQPDEPQVENVDHEFQFTGILVDVKEKSLSEFVVVVENPEGESQQLLVGGLNGERSQQVIQLRPQEVRQLNITPSSPPGYPIYAASSMQEFVPGTEIEGEADVSGAFYTIDYQLIDVNSEPPVPHNAWIVLLGGIVVIIATGSGFMINSRNTRLAIPKNRKLTTGIRDSPTYNFSEDDPAALKFAIFIKDWVKAWGLFVVTSITFVWGVLRLLGAEFHGTYPMDFHIFEFNVVIPELLENSMVYMMYGQFIFFMPCLLIGVYLARTKWIELSDVDPQNGDNYLYWLSPERYNDMRVITNIRKFNKRVDTKDDVITYEAPKNWLYDINDETRRESYECLNYDIQENVAEVSWSGELNQLNGAKVRSNQRMINYVFETSMWAIDQYHKLKDFFVVMVQEEANYLNARQQAILEEAQIPEYGSTRDRVESGLEKRNAADILESDQLNKAERLQEMRPEGEELMDEADEDTSISSHDTGGGSDE